MELGQTVKIRKTKGFSLIEVLIVIVILTILATIAVPQFNVYTHNNALKSAARDLAGDIQIIRQKAMAGSESTTVVLPYTLNFLSNTTYNYKLPSDLAPYPAVTINKSVTTFYPDITFIQTFPGNVMTFLSNGTIKETLVTSMTIILTNSRGSTVTLTVTNPSGRINVTYNMQ